MQTYGELVHRWNVIQYYIACSVTLVCNPERTARLDGCIVTFNGTFLSLNDIFTLSMEDWEGIEAQLAALLCE